MSQGSIHDMLLGLDRRCNEAKDLDKSVPELRDNLPNAPTRILPRHRKIIELALDGFNNATIARIFGIQPAAVGLILGSQTVQDELARRRALRQKKSDDAEIAYTQLTRETIEQASVEAAEKLREQIEHEDPKIAQGACDKILSLAFGNAGDNDAKKVPTTIVSVQQLNNINIALRELGAPELINSDTSPVLQSVAAR